MGFLCSVVASFHSQCCLALYLHGEVFHFFLQRQKCKEKLNIKLNYIQIKIYLKKKTWCPQWNQLQNTKKILRKDWKSSIWSYSSKKFLSTSNRHLKFPIPTLQFPQLEYGCYECSKGENMKIESLLVLSYLNRSKSALLSPLASKWIQWMKQEWKLSKEARVSCSFCLCICCLSFLQINCVQDYETYFSQRLPNFTL